jgi:nucleotide-binding universal stress UspA family protein
MTSMRRIVVGVDGSEYSLRALRWAVVEAGRHGAELVALTTWTALLPPILSPMLMSIRPSIAKTGLRRPSRRCKPLSGTQWPATLRLSLRSLRPRDIPKTSGRAVPAC